MKSLKVFGKSFSLDDVKECLRFTILVVVGLVSGTFSCLCCFSGIVSAFTVFHGLYMFAFGLIFSLFFLYFFFGLVVVCGAIFGYFEGRDCKEYFFEDYYM